MHKLVEDLERKLRRSRKKLKKKIINQVYRQIVPDENNGKLEDGKYKSLAEGGTEGLLELLLFVDQKFEEHGMSRQSQRLREHYSGLYTAQYTVPDDE